MKRLPFITISLRLLLFLSVTWGCAQAGTAEFHTCYDRWNDTELTVGNARLERKWRIHDGLLTATSLRNLFTGTEWIREPANGPASVAAGWRGAPRRAR